MCSVFFKLCCVGIFLCCMLDASKANKKNLEVTSFLASNKYDNSWIDWKTLRLTKTAPNRFVISGDVTANYNLGDEQKLEVKVLRKNPLTNSYSNFFSINKPICKFTASDQIAYPSILEHSNLPPAETCPIPKGDYTVKNFMLDAEKIPSSFPSGEYKLLLIISDGTKGVAGFEVDAVLTEEK